MNTFNKLPRRLTKWYGWKKDAPDHRDFKFEPPSLTTVLPALIDLRASCPPVYNQGNLGSCTGNSIAGAIQYAGIKINPAYPTPSRLFIYYGERVIEGTINTDSGAQIRDGIKVVAKIGAPPESLWPYAISKFKDQPSPEAFASAKTHKAITYKRVKQDPMHLMAALATGFPVVFGFSVFAGFESPEVAKTGIVPLPAPNERPIGGHAVLIVGYDNTDPKNAVFIVRNSWGADWGQAGYFTIPFSYVVNPDLADDFWCLELVD